MTSGQSSPPDPLAPSPDTSTGLPPNVAAGIAVLFPLVGGILFLILEKRNAFVRFYAMQSVLFGAVLVIAAIMFDITFAIFHLVPILGRIIKAILGILEYLLLLVWFIGYLILLIKAFSGVEWELPYLGRIARKQLATSRL